MEDKVVATLRAEAQALRKRLHAVEGSIRLLTGSSTPAAKTGTGTKPVKRHLSAASRKKLSEAAKKRWKLARHKGATPAS